VLLSGRLAGLVDEAVEQGGPVGLPVIPDELAAVLEFLNAKMHDI
jgi:hypothetical protein